MRTLLVDNHDSYTYNVFHLLAGVSGEEPIVVDNDAVSWRALERWDFDAIVLSPGPGTPRRWHDFCVCDDILRESKIPVLGICLGHQGLGNVLEGQVTSAPEAMHGRLSKIYHEGVGLFEGIPQGFSVVRYHSLAITGMGPDGNVCAWADDGVVMGIEHRSRPLWGVQFHPESVATAHGQALVRNFYALAERRKPAPAAAQRRRPALPRRRGGEHPARAASDTRLRLRSLDGEPSTEALFERLFVAETHAFWLDSADAPTRLARTSYLGTSAGADRCVLSYDVAESAVSVDTAAGQTLVPGSIFELLDRELDRRAVGAPEGAPDLLGGFVGYLGYELKADCGSLNAHRSDVPDAVLMLANRLVAVDHVHGRTHLIALCREGEEADAERWLDRAEAAVEAVLADPPAAPSPADPAFGTPSAGHVSFDCGRGRRQYLADIERSQAELAAGESYEVCLTDQISTAAEPDPFDLYRNLRRANPAPFAAFLKLGEVAVVSSSPERFLSLDRERRVEARPIKGTTRVVADPTEDAALKAELTHDEKTYAEHLMIVDLLRNDLGIVCEVGSVAVPELMIVEDYATVHQLISTVEGRLPADRSAPELTRACFPGGSMTGAPKLRTMEIIDDLEAEARGVYSGAIGWFGLDGTMDLSIVIRTIVLRPGRTTIGAGGAIVMQSDPQDEFDEILLKARAPMAAIARTMTGSDSDDSWSVDLEPGKVAEPA